MIDDCTVHVPTELADFLTVPPAVVFAVAGLPAPQGSKKMVGFNQGRPRLIEDNDAKKRLWRTTVAVEAQRLAANVRAKDPMFQPLDGPLFVWVLFRFPRPASCATRKYPHTKPDVDKLLRALFDSLKGVLIADDSRIVRVLTGKDFGEPGAVIGIGQLEARIAVPRKPRTLAIETRQEQLL